MKMSSQETKQIGLAVLGAVGGGVLGYFVYFWLIQQGFYGITVPGAFIGFGSSLGRVRHVSFAVGCGVAAVALEIFCEWRSMPFIADPSLNYFLGHLQDLRPITTILMALGGALAFWIPFRRR